MNNFEKIYHEQCSLVGVSAREDILKQIHDHVALRYSREGNSPRYSQNRFQNEELTALANALIKSNINYISKIDLSYNNLGGSTSSQDYTSENKSHEDAVECFCQLLRGSSSCQELNLKANCITGEDCERLCSAMAIQSPEQCRMKILDLSNNPIGDVGGKAIARLLASENSSLIYINLSDTRLDVKSIIAITTVLHDNQSLRCIHLDGPESHSIEEEYLEHIGRMLQDNKALQSISLQKHRMTDTGAQILARCLAKNKALSCLLLNANDIGSFGAAALAAAIKGHPRLQNLNLSANRIGDDGAHALIKILMDPSSNLKVLSLCWCSITNKGLCGIANLILDQRTQEGTMCCNSRFFLWGNEFAQESSHLFYDLFSTYRIETDFKPFKVDDNFYVAHQEIASERSYSSIKK